jgi:serine protease AprX
MKRLLVALATLAVVVAAAPGPRATAQIGVPVNAPVGVKIDPLLSSYFAAHAGASVASVVSFRQTPSSSDLSFLQSLGVVKGFKLQELPMVIADLNALQVTAIAQRSSVVSIYGNRTLSLFTNESRPFIGCDNMIADAEVRSANTSNPGFPISGKGIGIGYVDTGIDGTHSDLRFGADGKTVQNVVQPFSEMTVGDGGLAVGVGLNIADVLYETVGFYSPQYVENVPHSDLESGHGTHGAAVAAGTGEASGDFYGGVAPGAHLVGLNSGNELGLPLVAILGAYDYLLTHQTIYNVRVINNSWGSSLDASGIDPNNPINIATRKAHDRNMVVVFAAGNAGDTPTSINPYSTMPWVISVAAGEKRGLGTPADFSSRGVDNGTGVDVAGQPADPNAAPNLRPDVTAPGVDIKSARMKGPGITNTAGTVPLLGNDLTTIPPAFLPFYTTSQGRSFA